MISADVRVVVKQQEIKDCILKVFIGSTYKTWNTV